MNIVHAHNTVLERESDTFFRVCVAREQYWCEKIDEEKNNIPIRVNQSRMALTLNGFDTKCVSISVFFFFFFS